MPLETITVSIPNGSANPQTKTVQVNVDPSTGAGTGTITFTGLNAGVDSVNAAATVAGHALTSNTASLGWQGAPGPVSIGPVTLTMFANPGGAGDWSGTGAQLFGPSIFNSVIVNQPLNNTPIFGIVSPDGSTGMFKLNPPAVCQVKSDGSALTSGGTPIHGPIPVVVMQFNIVVSQPGIHTFYYLVDDAWALYIGNGASRAGGSSNSFTTTFGSSVAPNTFNGLPLIGTRNTPAPPPVGPTDTVYVNFPAAGVYSAVAWWVNNLSVNAAYFQMSYSPGQAAIAPNVSNASFGQVLLPVAIQPAPPPTTPAGNLQLSLANGGSHVVGQAATLNVVVTGIVYATEAYIPLLERTTGKLFLYNDPSNPVFSYPLYNGQAVDKTAAVTAGEISLSGNNSSWQGRLAPVFNDTGDGQYSIKYNGSGFDSHVDTTSLVVTAEDISWFFNTNKSFDLFAVVSGAGGLKFQITVDYLANPSPFVASVSPSTVVADGGQHIFTVSLAKPISPRQQGTQFGTGNTFSAALPTASGGVVVNSITPSFDGSGWLTGWSVNATVPHSTANGSFTLSMSVTGNITYLNGTVFTTGPITYVNGIVGTISTTGVTFSPPTEFAFSTVPSGTTVTGNITLNATVFSTDNGNISLTFYRQVSGTNISLGAGTLTSGPSPVSGGWLSSFTITVTSDFNWGSSFLLGFIATDTLSTLGVTWFGSTVYTNGNPAPPPPPGGGGDGCPAVEMWISEACQVAGIHDGMELVTLSGETPSLAGTGTEKRQIEWHSFSVETCYRLVAENGAEIVVSGSTPVLTREALEALESGIPVEELPTFASQIRVGMHVITDIGNGLEWSRLSETALEGMRQVARLYCGGRNFAAGMSPGKYIFTHNFALVVVK